MSIESSLWKREMSEVIAELDDGLNSRKSAEALRFLISTSMLAPNDIQKDPKKFFQAHRMLAKQVHRKGSGLWIRFTLHYNLFAGTVMELGSPQQIERLVERKLPRPCIGCFALMEQQQQQHNASKKNGLSIETTATLSADENYFIIHTPKESAAKNWVSQGLYADECILVATLMVHGNSYGPQAFWIKLRDEHGHLLEGIDLIDLGPKTAGSDLDNARITFSHLKVPICTHLCKYLEVRPNGTVRHHHALGQTVRTLDILGLHLYTGRVLVAQAALAFTRAKIEEAHDNNTKHRSCLSPRSSRVGNFSSSSSAPSSISKGFLSQSLLTLDTLDKFLVQIEVELRQCLLSHKAPPERLQQAIAVAKVEAVETSIDLCWALRNETEDLSLEEGNRRRSPGGDFLLCCKHAEGESHVLMQQMTRQLLSRLGGEIDARKGPVEAALHELQRGIMHSQIQYGCDLLEAWEHCSDLVYAAADTHMDCVLKSYGCLLLSERYTGI